MKKNYRENYPRAAETFASELLNVRCFNVKRDIRRPTENNRKQQKIEMRDDRYKGLTHSVTSSSHEEIKVPLQVNAVNRFNLSGKATRFFVNGKEKPY